MSPRTVVVPQYVRRVLFRLQDVSTTSPTITYRDLLSQEGKTAGYATPRFKAARVMGVAVWREAHYADASAPVTATVGLWLREGPAEDAVAPVGYDVGTVGAAQANVKALAGVWLSTAWDSTTTAFVQVTDGFGNPLVSPFVDVTLEVTAAFR
jgi:hypothetical protein